MSNLARIVSTPCPSTTFSYVKSVHVLANKAHPAEVPKTAPEQGSRRPKVSCMADLMPRVFVKNPADFQIHPEKLKQIIKEKDGQIFCNYLIQEGDKKRMRCQSFMEKRKKLMQNASIAPYSTRNMSLVRIPNRPTSYTSYINRQLHTTRKGRFSASSSGRRLSGGESAESVDSSKSRSKEIFFNLNAKTDPSTLSLAKTKQAKKKKNLKPLQVFKRTSKLSESSAANLPPDLALGAHKHEWVVLTESENESDLENVFKKNKSGEDRSKTRGNTVYSVERSTGSCDIRSSACKENLGDHFIDNVFTLFDKVKLDSKKVRSKSSREKELPVKNGTKTLAPDAQRTYSIINNTLKRKEMHLKRQFTQLIDEGTSNKSASKFVKEPQISEKTRCRKLNPSFNFDLGRI